MKDLIISINANTRKASTSKGFVGINGEHLNGNIVVDFIGEFIDGAGFLEIDNGENKYIIGMTKDGEHYSVPIRSSLLTKTTKLKLQFRAHISIDEDTTRIFKSEIIELPVLEAINAVSTIPDDYPAVWVSSIGGATGDIALGDGLAIQNGTLKNTGVRSIGGETGSVGVSGGLEMSGQNISGQQILNVAQGKTKSFTISYADNASFNSQADSLSGITSFETIAGETVQTTTLQNGDIILVIETEVPDRWWSAEDSKFYKMETSKIDLTDYATKNELDDKQDELTTTNVPTGTLAEVIGFDSNGDVVRGTAGGGSGGGVVVETKTFSNATAVNTFITNNGQKILKFEWSISQGKTLYCNVIDIETATYAIQSSQINMYISANGTEVFVPISAKSFSHVSSNGEIRTLTLSGSTVTYYISGTSQTTGKARLLLGTSTNLTNYVNQMTFKFYLTEAST